MAGPRLEQLRTEEGVLKPMYNHNQHLHFIGLGGVGMAGIAEILLNLGYSVSGSDIKRNSLIDHLEQLGAKVFIGHAPENVNGRTSVVIVSSAIRKENPELMAAEERGIPVIPRAEMLAELMRMKYGIAIAGSHGKTTTTSMTGRMLTALGYDPTVIIGGRVLTATTGARLGTGQYLVAEADESDGSFCLLKPAISVVTNVDLEHLTHYGSFGALEESFFDFMSSVPFYGLVIGCADDPITARLLGRLKRRTLRYGLGKEHEVSARDIQLEGPQSAYTLYVNGREASRVTLPMSGVHMVSNSLAAIAVAMELGADPAQAAAQLQSFPGVSRRTEVVAEHEGILVVDDYAHHPTEIAATLAALRQSWLPYQQQKYGLERPGRLVLLFQPHRYSRTKELFGEFLKAFGQADELFLGEIYPAGEEPLPGVSGEVLAAAVQHTQAKFFPDLADALPAIVPRLEKGDIVATLGAGSVGTVARELALILQECR